MHKKPNSPSNLNLSEEHLQGFKASCPSLSLSFTSLIYIFSGLEDICEGNIGNYTVTLDGMKEMTQENHHLKPLEIVLRWKEVLNKETETR